MSALNVKLEAATCQYNLKTATSTSKAHELTCCVFICFMQKKKCKNIKLWFYEGLSMGLFLSVEQPGTFLNPLNLSFRGGCRHFF